MGPQRVAQQLVPESRQPGGRAEGHLVTLSCIWGTLCVASNCAGARKAQRAGCEVGTQSLQVFLTFHAVWGSFNRKSVKPCLFSEGCCLRYTESLLDRPRPLCESGPSPLGLGQSGEPQTVHGVRSCPISASF